MGAAASLAALEREFELEHLHLKQMLALLEAERRELLGGGSAGLDAISAERLVQANALGLYAARRAALLAAGGFTADAAGLAACAAAAGERGAALAARWEWVAAAAAEVRVLNDQNRALMWRLLAAVAGGTGDPATGAGPAGQGAGATLSGCGR
jgi:flagellar biosynthesis/type III secretory pathway chaperone